MMTIEWQAARQAGSTTYTTKTCGNIITAQTMVSAAFGGVIRTLADKVHTPLECSRSNGDRLHRLREAGN